MVGLKNQVRSIKPTPFGPSTIAARARSMNSHSSAQIHLPTCHMPASQIVPLTSVATPNSMSLIGTPRSCSDVGRQQCRLPAVSSSLPLPVRSHWLWGGVQMGATHEAFTDRIWFYCRSNNDGDLRFAVGCLCPIWWRLRRRLQCAVRDIGIQRSVPSKVSGIQRSEEMTEPGFCHSR